MRKILLIGFKDVTIAIRDRAALLLMLLAPFLLTLGLGLVSGHFSGGNGSGLSNIPVVLVNQDNGQLGGALVNAFHSADLASLVSPTESNSASAARQLVDADKAAAAVIIPADFTQSIIPNTAPSAVPSVQGGVKIEIYANPTRPSGVGVIQNIVGEFLGRVESGSVGGQVAVMELLENGFIQPAQATSVGRALGQQLADDNNSLITISTSSEGNRTIPFDALAFMAPGMALLFLMYTVTYGGRSILVERSQGTLFRLLTSPTTATQVLGGKVLGIYLTGVVQLGILILASTLLFGLQWGDTLGIMILVLAAVFAATGWGLLITAFSRTAGQVGGVGSAVMLIFGILGGSFIDLGNMPVWVQRLSLITPNAWSLDGFNTLALGGALADILRPIVALFSMGCLLFAVSVVAFRRQWVPQK